jgi:hypothetical protein
MLVVKTLHAGEYFGEMSVLHSEHRAAAFVVAQTFVDTHALLKSSFDRLRAMFPELEAEVRKAVMASQYADLFGAGAAANAAGAGAGAIASAAGAASGPGAAHEVPPAGGASEQPGSNSIALAAAGDKPGETPVFELPAAATAQAAVLEQLRQSIELLAAQQAELPLLILRQVRSALEANDPQANGHRARDRHSSSSSTVQSVGHKDESDSDSEEHVR